MKILGISAYYHDSSAALIEDGKIIAAVQEERFTRIKNDSAFPVKSIQFCIEQAGGSCADIDQIVFFEKPFLKFERLLETYLAFAPKGFLSFSKAIPLWLHEKLFQKKLLQDELKDLGFSKKQGKEILFSSHHLSHAASAFFPSPHENALVLTMDGVGEWDTTTIYSGNGSSLKKIKELHFPHSLGLLYSAFTYHCGFKVNSGEYKLMGLAPYGKPRFATTIKKHLIDIKEDGSFRMDMSYFEYCTGLTMTNQKFNELFENSFRAPETELQQVHMDLAASVQLVLEEIIVKICCDMQAILNVKNLCLAGGVALNCVANGKIHKLDIFENIWVQPAAGDAGGSLGAALAAYHLHFQKPRVLSPHDSMQGAYLGPQYTEAQIEDSLKQANAVYRKVTHGEAEQYTAHELTAGKVIGWFQGRMEFGPRALGNRSIIADARNIEMQKKLNLKIKFRESFRPFAPAILESDVSDWFDFDRETSYMLMVANVKKDRLLTSPYKTNRTGLELLNEVRSQVPAITHVDCSARIQTVSARTNPRFHALLSLFKSKTGTPLIINTSFNIRGEPIVCSPADAYRCFVGTDMDILIIENFILVKEEQPFVAETDYRDQFKLD